MGLYRSAGLHPAEYASLYSALRGLGQRNRERSRRFKHASPRLFRLLKTAGIVVALWVLLLALWPLLR